METVLMVERLCPKFGNGARVGNQIVDALAEPRDATVELHFGASNVSIHADGALEPSKVVVRL